MKKKILFVIMLTILYAIAYVFVTSKKEGLVGPKLIQQITRQQVAPTPASVITPDAPKTFKFDSSTDLKVELEKVNPQVLDSDFE